MKTVTWVITILVSIGKCFGSIDEQLVQLRIKKIENGLVEFKFGPPDNIQTPKTLSISERMAFYKVPGVSIAVINGNKIEWAKAYGTLNADNGVPVTTDSYFEAASTTKMLVAALVLHFVGQGVLDLDRDVNNYLKSWKIPENNFSKVKKITLRLLLSHQSGLPSTSFPYEEGKVPSLVQVLKGESPAQNKLALVEYEPGSKWQYSNIGYVVIQLLLEDLTGKPLTQILHETIFKPLKMKASTLEYPLTQAWQKKEALPHNEEGKVCESSMHPTALAQGGLVTTPYDLALFTIELIRAYQGTSSKIMSKEMVRNMFHPEVDLDPAIFGVPLKQGLGVFLQKNGQNISFAHPGDNYPGATCWQIGIPGSGQGLVIMTNGAKGLPLAMEICAAIKKEYNWPAGL